MQFFLVRDSGDRSAVVRDDRLQIPFTFFLARPGREIVFRFQNLFGGFIGNVGRRNSIGLIIVVAAIERLGGLCNFVGSIGIHAADHLSRVQRNGIGVAVTRSRRIHFVRNRHDHAGLKFVVMAHELV